MQPVGVLFWNKVADHQWEEPSKTPHLGCYETDVNIVTSKPMSGALIGITTGYPMHPRKPYHFEPDHWSLVKSGWYVKSVMACCMSHCTHSRSFQSFD